MGLLHGGQRNALTRSADAGGAGGSGEALLSISNVSVRFGGVVALDGVSFDIRRGEILGLIGPNGAGKTTLFNCLSRLYIPNEGDITFEGRSILDAKPHEMADRGIGRTFQNLALFPTLPVIDNVMIGAHPRERGNLVADALRVSGVGPREKRMREEAWELIEALELGPYAMTPVGALNFATQKRVELARALSSEPKILLLDEPAGGLNHVEVEQLGERFKQIRDQFGLTILLVEHHLNLVMDVSDRVVAMDFGKKIAEGSPEHVRSHPDVISAYLGTAA